MLGITDPLWKESIVTSGSPHKGPVMLKEFPWHSLILIKQVTEVFRIISVEKQKKQLNQST